MEKIIEFCVKNGFLFNVNSKFVVAPLGALLQQQLSNEWFNNVVLNKDLMVVPRRGSFAASFSFVKHLNNGLFPFGIADNTEEVPLKNHDFWDDSNKEISFKSTVFVEPKLGVQIFHQTQRQRRVWWRKFAASPGRFKINENKSLEESSQVVELVADYPWGQQVVETISYKTSPFEGIASSELELKEGRKLVQAHHLTTETSSNKLLLNCLLDSYDEPLLQKQVRPLFYFHRKLAPFKISFAVENSDSSELDTLALYLSRLLRSNNISTLLQPGIKKIPLEEQWKRFDQIGIPYNILLVNDTLKNGLTLVRNRNTTLKEEVHVSELVKYVDLLFRNY